LVQVLRIFNGVHKLDELVRDVVPENPVAVGCQVQAVVPDGFAIGGREAMVGEQGVNVEGVAGVLLDCAFDGNGGGLIQVWEVGGGGMFL
jgi:hypothetical protein